MASLSRQLARWIVGLRYEDLPPAVVDRAKGVTLHALASVLIGSQTTPGRNAVKLIKDEETGVRNGATIMVDGGRATKGGAAFANSEMAFAGGCALNVKLNQKIIARDDVKELFVQPASGDAGTAVGAAAYVSHARGVPVEKMEHVYLGPSYSNEDVIAACAKHESKPVCR